MTQKRDTREPLSKNIDAVSKILSLILNEYNNKKILDTINKIGIKITIIIKINPFINKNNKDRLPIKRLNRTVIQTSHRIPDTIRNFPYFSIFCFPKIISNTPNVFIDMIKGIIAPIM